MLASRTGRTGKSLTMPRQLFGLPNPFDGATDSGIVAGMSKALGDVFSNIGTSLLQDVGGAALFLGSGLGAGAAQGLNVAPANMTKEVAMKVASDNGQQATGLNPAIMNAAMGATAALLGSVNVSSLAGSVGGLAKNVDIRGAALGLAEGLGNGTSAGLQLSQRAATLQAPPGNTTGDIAGTFGFGLTKTVTANINTSMLSAGNLGAMLQGVNISQFTGGQAVSQIALTLASGVGTGVSSGLKLTQANLQPPPGNDVGAALGAFGFGLTNSVTSNINTTDILAQAKNVNVGSLVGNISFGLTGQSFGSGLGSGLAAGLKLSSTIVDAPNPNSSDVPAVAGNFAFGLTKGLVENVNATMLIQNAQSSGAFSQLAGSLDVGRVAQGAAMGLVQGAGDAVNHMGGLQALINGTAMMPTTPLVTTQMTFNDSVGGAATGLGSGLGGQGTLVGVQLLSQLNVTSLLQQVTGGGGFSTAAAPQTKALNETGVAKRSNIFLPAEVVRRQAQVTAINNNNSFNLSLIINANTISQLGQRVIDTIGCDGIGGFALLGLGLFESGTISLNSVSSFNLTLIKQAIPQGVLKFTSSGNIYTIDGTVVANNIDSNILGAAGGITVNGSPVIVFAVFLIIHSKLPSLLVLISCSLIVHSYRRTAGICALASLGSQSRVYPQHLDPIGLEECLRQCPQVGQYHLGLPDRPVGRCCPHFWRPCRRFLWTLANCTRCKLSSPLMCTISHVHNELGTWPLDHPRFPRRRLLPLRRPVHQRRRRPQRRGVPDSIQAHQHSHPSHPHQPGYPLAHYANAHCGLHRSRLHRALHNACDSLRSRYRLCYGSHVLVHHGDRVDGPGHLPVVQGQPKRQEGKVCG